MTLGGHKGKSVVVEGLKGYFSCTVVTFDEFFRNPHLVDLIVSESVTVKRNELLEHFRSYLRERHPHTRFFVMYTNWAEQDSRLCTLEEIAISLCEEFEELLVMITFR